MPLYILTFPVSALARQGGGPVTGGAQLTDGQSGLVLRGVGVVLPGVADHKSPSFLCGGGKEQCFELET